MFQAISRMLMPALLIVLFFIVPNSMRWTPIWLIAPALGGAFAACVGSRVAYTDVQNEKFCYVIAAYLFGVLGWLMGLYGYVTAQDAETLWSNEGLAGAFVSFGILTLGAILALCLLPPAPAEEPAEARG